MHLKNESRAATCGKMYIYVHILYRNPRGTATGEGGRRWTLEGHGQSLAVRRPTSMPEMTQKVLCDRVDMVATGVGTAPVGRSTKLSNY